MISIVGKRHHLQQESRLSDSNQEKNQLNETHQFDKVPAQSALHRQGILYSLSIILIIMENGGLPADQKTSNF
jgi:hypothetical protein